MQYPAAVNALGNGLGDEPGIPVFPDPITAGLAVEDEPLRAARASALDLGGTDPVPPETGAVLRFLATATGARAAVEIGTGCGSSGIWLLRGMRPGGTLTSVDTEPEYQRMARQAFSQAGFASGQSRLILGQARAVLPRLSDEAYDIVFADADPADYPEYLTAALRLLRPGGIAAFHGLAADLPGMMLADERLIPMLLPTGRGLLAAVKRSG